MRDETLLNELLQADTELEALALLDTRDLLDPKNFKPRWRYLGGLPNNQAVVLTQQSFPGSALVEKYTNSVDSILLRRCKAAGIDPRSAGAPQNMQDAVEKFFGDLDEKNQDQIRALAEESVVLYATGRKDRPSLSLYDNGEGQLGKHFSKTFCSLISAGEEGSYKKGVRFVQGQFNMGGTGVLPFCSEKRKLQLIVSRVPPDVAKGNEHEWAFTLFCFFEEEAAWCYLVGNDGEVLTAGSKPVPLLPKAGTLKKDEIPQARARAVPSGTLIKMFDFQAPKSNICGELAKKIEEYLLHPALPMRLIECREGYAANVMAVNAWDHMGRWKKRGKLEEGFEDGASIEIELSNGEKVPGEIRVFTSEAARDGDDAPHTGVRALINGQSHAKRDARFFRTKQVDLDHVAGSMLVTLMCEGLSKSTKNQLFMSNRETFRDGPILNDLLEELQTILRGHEELRALNARRYAEKVKDAIRDEDGIKALEELLSTDPALANLFGTLLPGAVAARTATNGAGGTVPGKPAPFKGLDFPSFFHRGKEKETTATTEIPQGGSTRVSFVTDVKNNYFTRRKPPRGQIKIEGTLSPSYSLFNGRLIFTCRAEKKTPVGSTFTSIATISDNHGSGPFVLTINSTVVAPPEDKEKEPRPPRPPRLQAGPSQPDVKEKALGPDEPPLKIESHPETKRLQIIINSTSPLLEEAKTLRPKSEHPAVEFVFKYGLALAAMGLLDSVRSTPEWESDQAGCRDRVQQMAKGVARVIVPLCLSLPKNLPKAKA